MARCLTSHELLGGKLQHKDCCHACKVVEGVQKNWAYQRSRAPVQSCTQCSDDEQGWKATGRHVRGSKHGCTYSNGSPIGNGFALTEKTPQPAPTKACAAYVEEKPPEDNLFHKRRHQHRQQGKANKPSSGKLLEKLCPRVM